MKYFIIAGEASGDLHGSNLISAIQTKDPQARFLFWGGDKMASKADGLLKHYKELSIMGFLEVVLNIRTIFNNIKLCKQQINEFNPDCIILIDYPGFNLRIAEWGKNQGYKIAYYIAPKVWAWKENRVKKLEQFVDKLLIVFPFEMAYFKRWKVNATYVGNPLLDELSNQVSSPTFYTENNLKPNVPIIALLPGSRKQEIRRMLPRMLKAVQHFSNYQFVIAGAPSIEKDFYTPYLLPNTNILYNQTYAILQHSNAAIVCSGTATLETALLNVPQVCGYVANSLSYAIARRLVRIKYISLVNLNMDKPCITELIQDAFTTENLISEMKKILPNGSERERMLSDYESLRTLIGAKGASDKAAHEIITLCNG